MNHSRFAVISYVTSSPRVFEPDATVPGTVRTYFSPSSRRPKANFTLLPSISFVSKPLIAVFSSSPFFSKVMLSKDSALTGAVNSIVISFASALIVPLFSSAALFAVTPNKLN